MRGLKFLTVALLVLFFSLLTPQNVSATLAGENSEDVVTRGISPPPGWPGHCLAFVFVKDPAGVGIDATVHWEVRRGAR